MPQASNPSTQSANAFEQFHYSVSRLLSSSTPVSHSTSQSLQQPSNSSVDGPAVTQPLHALLVLVLLLEEAPTGHSVAPATDPLSPGHTHTLHFHGGATGRLDVSRKIASLPEFIISDPGKGWQRILSRLLESGSVASFKGSPCLGLIQLRASLSSLIVIHSR